MYLKRIADEVSALINDTTLGSTGVNYARTKMWIRDCYYNDIISRCSDWWFLRSVGYIQTVAEITAGTVSVTEGSTSVTGSGTSFTSAVNGRLLIIGGKVARVASSGYVSSTSLTLDYAWEGDTASGVAYSIVKDKYALPRWLDPKKILQIKGRNTRPLTGMSPQEIDSLHVSKSGVGTPNKFSVVSRERTFYTTGTVTVTSGSKTITGSSTSWDSTIEQYDKITIGSNSYTVDTVDSSTQITVLETPRMSESAGSSYQVIKDRYYIELYPYPNKVAVYNVLGCVIPPNLDDDGDVPYLPDEFYPLLTKGAYVRALKHNGDQGVSKEIEEFQFMLKRLIASNYRDDYRTESWWK